MSNIYNLYQCGFSKDIKCKKDAFYEFLNSSKIDWRRILMLFAKQFLKIVAKKYIDTSQKRKYQVLIVDDTFSPKTGKTIEFIGKVFDHSKRPYQLGMKVLTLGYWDGKSFILLEFSIHNESVKSGLRGLKGKEIANQFKKVRHSTDASIATITLCFMNYTMITLIRRFNDCESIGIMFRSFKDNLLSQTLDFKLWEIFTSIYINILADLGVQWEMFVSALTNDDSLISNLKQSFAFLMKLDPSHSKNYA